MASASFLFLLFLVFQKIYFWKYSRNWTKIYWNYFYAKTKTESRGQPRRRPIGQGQPAAAASVPLTGGIHPCPWAISSVPSDAYKITLNLKISRRPLFSRNLTRHAVTENPSSGSNLKLIPALCRRGDRSQRALHRHAFLRDDL